jgi:hypothetical protein
VGRAYWYADYFLKTLWEETKDKSTADEAVRTASDLALNKAIGRATALAAQFLEGKEVIKVGDQLLAPREVGELVYLQAYLF